LLTLVQLPIFLFSATFFPISTYPHGLQWLVRVSPLYHATQLLRALNFGTLGWAQALDLAYLLALGLLGVYIAQRRLGRALLR
jgi:lipooligosaccharide transport system permease protein